MSPPRPVHANFREAYCHRHGCSADRFERHLLLRIIPLPFRPLAALSYWLGPEIFASELEVIRNAAPARTGREVNAAAQDLVHLRFVENSFRRSIGMRGRSELVVEAWNRVKETVDRPAIPDHPSVGFTESASRVKAASRSAALGRRDSALTVRFLERLQAEARRGASLAGTIGSAGLTAEQLVELLDSNPKDLPRFKDLRERLVLLLRDRGNDPEPPPGAPVRTADNPRSPSLS